MQLDIFNDSRDVMLRNDVVQALAQHDVSRAQSAWLALERDYPEDDFLARAQLLLDALQARNQQDTAFAGHADLQSARRALLTVIEPAAQRLMGRAGAALWLRPFWGKLIERAAHVSFDAEFEFEHVAPMRLHLEDWQGALDAASGIESWRRRPAPLAWMVQAKLRLHGLRASWALLAELVWLAPKRLDALIQSSPEPTLQRLKDQFDARFEPQKEGADAALDLAWFPAWVLTEQPQYLGDLAQAQPAQHSAPEQALRLLVNLLGLERQGRHRDIVNYRKSLRDLNGWLYGDYMKTR